MENCHQKYFSWKICIFSFPKPSLKCLYHLWFIFTSGWSLVKMTKLTKIADFCDFFKNQSDTYMTLKIDLNIVKTFWDRFWNAQGPYFPFLILFLKFSTFCNPNGIHVFSTEESDIVFDIPFWFQKGIKNGNLVVAILMFEKYWR